MSISRLAALAACGCVVSASQASVVWSGSSGNLAASATFDVNGSGQLEVTLTNTSTNDVLIPADILTSVFFEVSGGPLVLTNDLGVLAGGSTVFFGPDGAGVIGGEWAHKVADSGPFNGRHGISASGLGVFGKFDVFPGGNLAEGDAPGGMEYGLLSAGDDTTTGNTPVTGGNALIKNSVFFKLGGAGSTFDLSRITKVAFQYGTSFTEPSFEGDVPAPGVLAGLGAFGVMAGRRRR